MGFGCPFLFFCVVQIHKALCAPFYYKTYICYIQCSHVRKSATSNMSHLVRFSMPKWFALWKSFILPKKLTNVLYPIYFLLNQNWNINFPMAVRLSSPFLFSFRERGGGKGGRLGFFLEFLLLFPICSHQVTNVFTNFLLCFQHVSQQWMCCNNTSFCPNCLSQRCFSRTYIGRPIQTYILISLFGENIF